jgi:predicted Zn-dependent protease with MMP-like domain
MDRRRFQELVEQAFARLPKVYRDRITNVAIIVEDFPPRGAERDDLLLGLFHGIPRTEKSTFFSSPPDRIYLYQKNIEAVCYSEEEIRQQIRDTLLHEVGHYFGLSEDELREL